MNRPAEPIAADNRVAYPHAAVEATPDDLRLQQALQSLPPPLDAARLGALQARVLQQWQAGEHRTAAHRVNGHLRDRTVTLLSGGRGAWVLASGLFVSVSLAAVFWLQRPDPAMDDLLQPDVLSQMAIGEL